MSLRFAQGGQAEGGGDESGGGASQRLTGRHSARWTNWAANQSCAPVAVHEPATEGALIEVVRLAAREHERVKVVGSGHSFTGVALTDGHLVDMSSYDEIVNVDHALLRVEVQVGKKLSSLNDDLWALGMAMPDLGDIAYQSIAGAISTGTHGTGINFGCLATSVVAARVIDHEGEVIECSPEHEPDVFRAAIVGVGAAGILSTVTLQLEAAFHLHALEQVMPLSEVLDRQESLVAENEHFEYFCQPGRSWAFTKRNNRTSRPPESLSPLREWYEETLINDWTANALLRLERLPAVGRSLRRRLQRLVPSTGRQDYVDRSYRVFTSERRVKFYEMEYFIPREHAREALERVFDFVDRAGLRLSMPIEVRWAAADDIPLSMCHDRETVSIAVHVRRGEPFEPYFVPVETIMRDYDGRPHWGKLHFQTAETLAPLYPAWEAFQQTRRRLDPLGMFANAYTDRVLGPVDGTR